MLPTPADVDDFKSSPGPNPKTVFIEARERNPLVGLVALRTKNRNAVVYQVNTTPAGEIDEKEPVIAYWLDVDKEYVKKHRKNKVNHDRVEFNWADKNIAWGFKAKKMNATTVKFTFMFFDNDPLFFKWSPKQKRIVCEYRNKNRHRVDFLFVDASDNVDIGSIISGVVRLDMTELAKKNMKEVVLHTQVLTKNRKTKPAKVKIDVQAAIEAYKSKK